MLDARFPTYSPGSRRLFEFEVAGDTAQLLAEIRRSVHTLVHAADNRVAKGQLTAAEADAMAAVWHAVARDLEGPVDRSATAVAWADKVAALRREIEARRAGYPGQVEKGQLTRDQARSQLERLEAVHDLYWRHGFAFDGTRDELRTMTNPILDFDVEQQGAAIVAPRQEALA